MKAKGDRNCGNCAFQQLFKYSTLDKQEMMRCWEEPGVEDHAFVQTAKRGNKYVCCSHRTREEQDKELYKEAKFDYACYKSRIDELEKRWPELKDMDWYDYLHGKNYEGDDVKDD